MATTLRLKSSVAARAPASRVARKAVVVKADMSTAVAVSGSTAAMLAVGRLAFLPYHRVRTITMLSPGHASRGAAGRCAARHPASRLRGRARAPPPLDPAAGSSLLASPNRRAHRAPAPRSAPWPSRTSARRPPAPPTSIRCRNPRASPSRRTTPLASPSSTCSAGAPWATPWGARRGRGARARLPCRAPAWIGRRRAAV